ncbi:hypothetical protein [Tuberibacillus sp. Marseille-P3662]|uniref:hypothetical protein n=1 Tax=Tuberibacillus sp. Marseille-P3662 TaxID=1965358 RepID=UPI000A1CC7EA|nr:hypothetical protein [Tuberibacillus sp. Marseille-P3662]
MLRKINIGIAIIILIMVTYDLISQNFEMNDKVFDTIMFLLGLSFGTEKLKNNEKFLGGLWLFVAFVILLGTIIEFI